MSPTEPAILWTPSSARAAGSALAAYMTWLRESRGQSFEAYADLWRWSVDEIEAFWHSLAEYFGVRWHMPPQQTLVERRMPGADWFPGGTLNWSEHAVQADAKATAIVYRSEAGERVEWSFGELRDRVARVRAGLRRLGVGRGDRVAGYLANTPEAVAALLACASLGAVWSSCPPEFGVSAVLDRFRQIEPKVLLAHDGYPYNGRFYDRSAEVEEIRSGLTGLEATVVLKRAARAPRGALSWEELTAEPGPLEFAAVPFSHPLWILYSSGTTGLPKAIVHGHGGILLEHLKQLALQNDLGAGDRFFWYSTTGWMMWNYLVSGLLLGTTIVLYEGAPAHPDLMALFRMADEEGVSYFGTSAPFLIACRKAGLEPGRQLELASLRALGSTGAPLPEEGFAWVYESLKGDLMLASISGGSDVCTAFVGGAPILPVRTGEIPCRGLGTAAQAFDETGEPVLGEVGELVITEPMPSMPVFFWGDPEGERYRESYFADYPGVWRHGDWIRFDAEGRSVIFGRSDSTLNRGGVRMGTSEFYRVVDTLPEIADSLVIDTGTLGREGELWLFVVLREGHELDDALAARLRRTLREALSPRHVPDEIRAVPDVPRTLSGKKLEVPIRKLLAGVPEEKALKRGTLANPECLAPLLAAARHDELMRNPRAAGVAPALEKLRDRAHGAWRDLWAAEILRAQGELDQAVAALEKVAEAEDPEIRMSAWASLGDLYEDLEQTEKAAHCYALAVEVPAVSVSGAFQRARLLWWLDRTAEAKLAFESALENAEESEGPLLEQLARGYLEFCQATGIEDEGRKKLGRLAARFPRHPGLAEW